LRAREGGGGEREGGEPEREGRGRVWGLRGRGEGGESEREREGRGSLESEREGSLRGWEGGEGGV
jgi:hypothetical protein